MPARARPGASYIDKPVPQSIPYPAGIPTVTRQRLSVDTPREDCRRAVECPTITMRPSAPVCARNTRRPRAARPGSRLAEQAILPSNAPTLTQS
ncbi:hypothetical protein Lfu02_36680 [Longispora fulva]|nr:hypothetical protein Lfu02_36680 [Longispora fulva]